MSQDILEITLHRVMQTAADAKAASEKLIAACEPFKGCPTHNTMMPLNCELTAIRKVAVYDACPQCAKERAALEVADRLARQGVPANLHRATFENWIAHDPQEEVILQTAKDFAAKRAGFLLMLGDFGTGKTHLAVAILRQFKSAMLIKQSELLRRLRASYRDKAATDPVDEAQDVGLLVLDEMGLSAGGRDELPLLHDVLDYRHGNRRPTILTGNVSLDKLKEVVGERMADRLRESCFGILNFTGPSNRKSSRESYFSAQEATR